jgi:hypothetical protein
MKFSRLMTSTCYALLIVLACFNTFASAGTWHYPPYKADKPSNSDRFDRLYYIQPHNTYHYDSYLTKWLENGYRSLELDVHDKDSWESNPKGPYVGHDGPEHTNCSGSGLDRLGD